MSNRLGRVYIHEIFPILVTRYMVMPSKLLLLHSLSFVTRISIIVSQFQLLQQKTECRRARTPSDLKMAHTDRLLQTTIVPGMNKALIKRLLLL